MKGSSGDTRQMEDFVRGDGKRGKEVYFFFTFCVASLLLSISPKYRKRQGPEYMSGKRKKGTPPTYIFFFLSFAGMVYIRSSSSFSFSVLLILALSLLPLSYWGMKSYSHTEEPVKRRGNGKKRLAQEGRLGNSEQAMGLHIHSGC